MNLTAFILFAFGLQLICLLVGSQTSKEMKNQEDYFLGGKSARFFPLMMTFLATQVGGGLFLGSTEEAYKFGWTVLLYPLGQSLGFVLLGLGIGRKLAELGISTIAQIFEVVYRSVLLKKVAAIFSIVSLFLILVAQIIASSKFMTSLGFHNPFWFCMFWGIVILYTSVGGFKAVVSTDVVQAVFFIIGFICCFGYVMLFSDMATCDMCAITTEGDGGFAFNPLKLYAWLLMPMLFAVIEQDMGQRCFAAESPKVVSKATLCAGALTMLICIIPVFFGVFARKLGIIVPEGESVLMVVVKQTTTPILSAMVGCAILAAIISTASSLINAISSNLSQDFNFTFLKRGKICVMQAVTALIAASAIFISFSFDNVVDLMIQSYELSVCCLFIPIILSLFRKKGNAISATLAIVCGATGFVLFRIAPTELPKEIISVLLSLMGYCIGEVWQWMTEIRSRDYIYEK